MPTRYKLLFRGQISPDQHVAVVRGRLQKILKASDGQLDVMFSGKPVTIKKDADEATVERYLEAFVKAGAKLEIVELDSAALAEAARKAEMVAAAEAHKAQLIKEVLEAEQAEIEQAEAAAMGAPASTPHAQANSKPPSPSESSATASVTFALAEVGADLVTAADKQPAPEANVVTDHLSLAEVGGNLMAPTETVQPQPPPPVDTSHLTLDEPGTTLGVPATDRADIDSLIEFDFELGEVGELLVESAPPVVATVPDLGQFELEKLPEAAAEEPA